MDEELAIEIAGLHFGDTTRNLCSQLLRTPSTLSELTKAGIADRRIVEECLHAGMKQGFIFCIKDRYSVSVFQLLFRLRFPSVLVVALESYGNFVSYVLF